jgi:NAD(P)-dependent dehydrogenase (short-subunit alcohol dehydrogenase family)/acyl carrier protein
VAETLLGVVAEKTGYPVDSLDLSLSLDDDLGVDSIKRVEILSALQEKLPDAPVVRPEHLGTLRTLNDVVVFLSGTPSVEAVQPPPKGKTVSSGSDPRFGDPADEGGEGLVRTMPISASQLALLRETPDVSKALLAVVAEKTGYPVESLDLSLALDDDLGVDSIKRVEILSALQEKLPDAPIVRPEHLGTLRTLNDVAAFLAGNPTARGNDRNGSQAHDLEPDTAKLSGPYPPRLTDSAAEAARANGVVLPPPRPVESVPQPIGPFGGERVDRSILQLVDLDPIGQRDRVPVPEKALFWVVGERGPLTDSVESFLRSAKYEVLVHGWGDASTAKPPIGPLGGLVLLAPAAPDLSLNRRAFDWLKAAAAKLRQTGRAGGAVFATVARFDGAFGLADVSPDADPTAGGLAGLVKTARHEWPEVSCKAIDLAPTVTDPLAAGALAVTELLIAGPTEVGIATNHRCTIELARTARRPTAHLINLGARDVILVTGGGRGVTAEVAVALAETYGAAIVLTGRTPAPSPEPEYLIGITDEAEMKAALTAAMGSSATPRTVGDAYKAIVAQREVQHTLARLEEAGARVAYIPADVTDGRAVADLLHRVRVKFGPVTAVVHGAGVLADKRIEDLSGEQFDFVYSTKVEGLRTVLELLAHEDLKALILFSSTTARLGRTGQIAYACANEVLNKTAQVEARRRPGSRVIAINWGPWDGGMVGPSLKRVFEGEGVGVIPLQDGAAFLIQELNAAGRAVEVVALGKPATRASGVAADPVPPAPAQAPVAASAAPAPAAPIMSPPSPLPSAEMTVAFERMVDVASHPVLRAHVLDGLAVLPVSIHLEWLAHAALHGSPGLLFHGFNDLRVTTGLKIEGSGEVQLRAVAGKAVKQDKQLVVPVELRGRHRSGRELIYSRAEIVLAQSLPKAPPADSGPAVSPLPYDVNRAYREYLFHGPDLRGIAELIGRAQRAFVVRAYTAPPPAEWFEFPLRSGWLADPLVLDTAFQTMILWTQGEHNSASLPSFIGRYRQFSKAFPADTIEVIARITRDESKFARADIDFLHNGQTIAQMQDYECIMEPSLNASFRKNQLAMKVSRVES